MKAFIFTVFMICGVLAKSNSTSSSHPKPSSQQAVTSTQQIKTTALPTTPPSTSSSAVPPVVKTTQVKTSSSAVSPVVKTTHVKTPSSAVSPVVKTTHVKTSSSAVSPVVKTTHVKTSSSAVPSTPSSVTPVPTHHTSHAVTSTNSIHPSSASSAVVSSSAAPTTSKPPTHKTTPSPDVEFAVKNKNNKECLWVKGAINVTLSYVNKTGATKKDEIHLVKKGVKIDGLCSNLLNSSDTSKITLTYSNLLIFTLRFGADAKLWYLKEIDATYLKEGKVDGKIIFDNKSNDRRYMAPHNHSYNCIDDKSWKLNVTNVSAGFVNATLVVLFKDIELQPFSAPNNSSKPFINSITCPATTNDDDSSSIVPIAVGCALAGLIVIVLIAYLIGRRKGNNRGYQQV